MQTKTTVPGWRLMFFVSLWSAAAAAGCGGPEQPGYGLNSIHEVRQGLTGPLLYRPDQDGSDEQGPDFTAAIGKCKEKYPDMRINDDRRAACVHMFMAQYYGSLKSAYTFQGTLINWADSDTPLGTGARPWGTYIDSGYTHHTYFEAIWGINGALCLSYPRWRPIHDKFKPTSSTLPDCGTDPKNSYTPWIENPFAGTGANKGLLVSYAVNWDLTPLTIRMFTYTGVYATAGDVEASSWRPYSTYNILDEVLVHSSKQPPRRVKHADEYGIEYELDPSFISLSSWNTCHPKGTLPYCDSITTADDLTLPSERGKRSIPGTDNYQKDIYTTPWGTEPNTVYAVRTAMPGTVPLITYRDSTGRHLTATAEAAKKLTTRTLTPVYVEGYVYPIVLNDIDTGRPRVCSPPCVDK